MNPFDGSPVLLAATARGVATCKWHGGWQGASMALADVDCTAVAVAREAGTDGDDLPVVLVGGPRGLLRSVDGGADWVHVAGNGLSGIRALACHPIEPRTVFLGAEPARILVSRNGGLTWERAASVEELRDRLGWFLPYSPAAGCVRGFAATGQYSYAAVEVGGVLVSPDSGGTWSLPDGSSGKPSFGPVPDGQVHPDVHSVDVDPFNPARVLAATAGGVYGSTDYGASWQRVGPAMYTRAILIDPHAPDHLLAGPADGVGSGGTLLESEDGGASWRPAIAGLDAPWPDTMVERLVAAPPEVMAVLADGRVFSANFDEMVWRPRLADAGEVRWIAWEPGGSPAG